VNISGDAPRKRVQLGIEAFRDLGGRQSVTLGPLTVGKQIPRVLVPACRDRVQLLFYAGVRRRCSERTEVVPSQQLSKMTGLKEIELRRKCGGRWNWRR
jgi:hypothetical protein